MGVNVYNLQIGTKVTIGPSDFTTQLSEQHGTGIGNDYDKTYEIVDVSVEYSSKHPHADYKTPFITITVFLKPIK